MVCVKVVFKLGFTVRMYISTQSQYLTNEYGLVHSDYNIVFCVSVCTCEYIMGLFNSGHLSQVVFVSMWSLNLFPLYVHIYTVQTPNEGV